MAKRKTKEKTTFKVYCTYFPNGHYYIGFSTKMGAAYEKYFGSSKYVKEWEGELKKETIQTYEKRSHARMAEFILQWQNRHDDRCLNDMINIRLRMSHLSDFIDPEWTPTEFDLLEG